MVVSHTLATCSSTFSSHSRSWRSPCSSISASSPLCRLATSLTCRIQLSARPTRWPSSAASRPQQPYWPTTRMCSTLSTSTANWITDRQLRSVCTTTLAILRWTKTSPGAMSTIWLAGTRESEQPIHRNLGVCNLDRRSKKLGSSASMREAQASFFSSSSSSRLIGGPGAVSAPLSHSDADVPWFGEKAHGLEPAFAAQAGLPAAAERRTQVAQHPAVDPHDAHAQCGGEAMGALEVAGPQRGREPVLHRIGQLQRLVFVFEGLQGGDRAEDLLPVAGRVRPEACDHGRLDEPARPGECMAAAQHAAAFRACRRDRRGDLVEVRLRDQRAQLGVRVDRIAESQRAHVFDEGFGELAFDAALDQDARAAQADLTAVLEGRAHQGIHVRLPVAVGEDQGRVLAAEFQREC